jgi:AcrR family transcriptional regulator
MAATTRAPRKDQLRNRRRLLDAARAAFSEHGLDLSIESIARSAGVGPTTFYRHFPTKEDLVYWLLEDLAQGARQLAAEVAEIPDDWQAFARVFTQGCVLDPEGLQLFDALGRTSAQASEHGRQISAGLITPVAERARRSGQLRPDVTAEDVAALMRMADSAATEHQRQIAQDVMLAGLRGVSAS